MSGRDFDRSIAGTVTSVLLCYGCLATFRRNTGILACKGGPAKLGEKFEFHVNQVWNLP